MPPSKKSSNLAKVRNKGSVKGRRRSIQWPKNFEDFCQAVFDGYNHTEAAVLAGFAPASAAYLARRPDIKARLIELPKEYKEEAIKRKVDERLLTTRFLDENLIEVIKNGEGEGKRGRTNALLIGYKSKFLVDPPSPQTMIQLNNQQTNGGAGGGLGGPPKLYRAQRFLKQDEPVVVEGETTPNA